MQQKKMPSPKATHIGKSLMPTLNSKLTKEYGCSNAEKQKETKAQKHNYGYSA